MTNSIAYDFLHHPYYRVSKAIMPCFECIDILENHFICNMWYGFYVCIVQSRQQGRYSFQNIMAISIFFSNEEKFFIIFFMGYNM
jgi:hypothetical protein